MAMVIPVNAVFSWWNTSSHCPWMGGTGREPKRALARSVTLPHSLGPTGSTSCNVLLLNLRTVSGGQQLRHTSTSSMSAGRGFVSNQSMFVPRPPANTADGLHLDICATGGRSLGMVLGRSVGNSLRRRWFRGMSPNERCMEVYRQTSCTRNGRTTDRTMPDTSAGAGILTIRLRWMRFTMQFYASDTHPIPMATARDPQACAASWFCFARPRGCLLISVRDLGHLVLRDDAAQCCIVNC